ncbi:hypothetical protein ACFQ21_00290 [Ohtaekwangia kribbensis]|jgi:hypothetical protein|uniref:Uncharacterized protein n=1 Tax=Ohtaekwangia kribbensis TaxID=688913 RepID=A0ABW3JVX3_9BACT
MASPISKQIATIDEQISLIAGARKILEETPGAQVCYSGSAAYIFREIQENLLTLKLWRESSDVFKHAEEVITLADELEKGKADLNNHSERKKDAAFALIDFIAEKEVDNG